MTTPIHSPSGESPIGPRLLFGALGLIALGIATIITLGAAIAGVISILIAGAMLSRREKQLTRRGAWFASVGGTMAVFVALLAITMFAGPEPKPMTAEQRAESRARAQELMPEWMRQLNPNGVQRASAADSVAEQLLANKGVMIWAGLMGAVIGSTVVGVIAGSFAWGGFMLLYRGLRGRWLAKVAIPLEQPV